MGVLHPTKILTILRETNKKTVRNKASVDAKIVRSSREQGIKIWVDGVRSESDRQNGNSRHLLTGKDFHTAGNTGREEEEEKKKKEQNFAGV